MQEELDSNTHKTERWVNESTGKWQSGHVVLTVSSLNAEQFHDYFMGLTRNRHEPALRCAHPEHYRNRLLASGPEIIEHVGEDDTPWHIFGRFVAIDALPAFQPDRDFPVGFGLEAKNTLGTVVVYAGHELRDYRDGMQAKLTIILPEAADKNLVRGHLNHFTVEFRNWCLAALEF